MRNIMIFLFAIVIFANADCFAQTPATSKARARIISIPGTLKEYNIGLLASLKDTIRVFDSIQRELIKNIKLVIPEPIIGRSTISDVEKIEGCPKEIKRFANSEAMKLVYDSVIYFFKNDKLDFVSDKRHKKPVP